MGVGAIYELVNGMSGERLAAGPGIGAQLRSGDF